MLWVLQPRCIRLLSNARSAFHRLNSVQASLCKDLKARIVHGGRINIFKPPQKKKWGFVIRIGHSQGNKAGGGGAAGNNGNNKGGLQFLFFLGTGLSLFVVYYFHTVLFDNANTVPGAGTTVNVTWKQFIEEILPSGEVKRIHVNKNVDSHSVRVELQPGATINGMRTSALIIPNLRDVDEVEDMVRGVEKHMGINPNSRIPIVYHLFDPKIILFLIAGIALLLYLNARIAASVERMVGSSDLFKKLGSAARTAPTGIKFSDVSGSAEAKQEVMEFVHYLKHPEKYEQLGAKMPRGCLLTGPPGVGKTLLAKAVATEADVPFLLKAGSDFVEMVGGLGARRVRDLFKEARSLAPCIIYIDELDAVGGMRSDEKGPSRHGSSEKDQTLNQILVEMDGMFSSDHKIIVMASTNRADMLDKALLRPGRFDRHITIDLPTRVERKEIFETHLKGLKLLKSSGVYSERLANLTPGMSGADIANICNEAAIYAAREKDLHIDTKHFEYAVERIIAGSARRSSSLTPSERNIVAVHEAGHTLVGWLLKHTDALVKVSIVPRTKTALGFVRTLPSERHLLSQSQFSDIMCMTLAGRAAENLVFGTVTQGAQDDLKKVTDMAYTQVKHLGFSPAVGNLSFAGHDESYVKPYSDTLATVIDHEVNKLVDGAHRRAEGILRRNKEKLDLLSSELLNNEVLNYVDIVKLIGKPPHGDKAQVEHIDTGPSFGTPV